MASIREDTLHNVGKTLFTALERPSSPRWKDTLPNVVKTLFPETEVKGEQ
jgi:hypothetical protein